MTTEESRPVSSSFDPISDLLWKHSMQATTRRLDGAGNYIGEPTRCACGWEAEDANPGWHRLHVAWALNARIRAAMAEAWVEGERAGFTAHHNYSDQKPVNPYDSRIRSAAPSEGSES